MTAALPACVPAARPRWSATVDDWFILCLDAVDGHMPGLPWRPVELDAALAAWATAAQALREPPPVDVDLPHFSDACQESFTTWRQIAAHRAPVPPMPRYALAHLDDLAALEGRLAELAVGHRGLMHFDLRLDNVLISDDGAAWLCDWNWLCHGPAWFDTGGAAGHGVRERDRRGRAVRRAPDGAGRARRRARREPGRAVRLLVQPRGPALRSVPEPERAPAVERGVALAWLAERAGWATAGAGFGPARPGLVASTIARTARCRRVRVQTNQRATKTRLSRGEHQVPDQAQPAERGAGCATSRSSRR